MDDKAPDCSNVLMASNETRYVFITKKMVDHMRMAEDFRVTIVKGDIRQPIPFDAYVRHVTPLPQPAPSLVYAEIVRRLVSERRWRQEWETKIADMQHERDELLRAGRPWAAKCAVIYAQWIALPAWVRSAVGVALIAWFGRHHIPSL